MGKLGWVRSSLALGFLVKAEHHCPLRGVQVQTHHVDQLVFELRVFRELEGVDLPGFEPVSPPNASDAVLSDSQAIGKGPSGPVRRSVIGTLFARHPHHFGHRPFRKPGLAPSPRGNPPHVVDPFGLEPAPPLPHGVGSRAHPPGDLVVGHPVGCRQQGLGLHHRAVRRRSRTGHSLQFDPLFVAHH